MDREKMIKSGARILVRGETLDKISYIKSNQAPMASPKFWFERGDIQQK